MTERKRWPNEAEWARQEAIAQARRGLQAARTKREAGLVEIIDVLHEIIHNLMRVGPGGSAQEIKMAGMVSA